MMRAARGVLNGTRPSRAIPVVCGFCGQKNARHEPCSNCGTINPGQRVKMKKNRGFGR